MAARREMNLREALAWLCAAEVARKDQLRMEMALRLARFPDGHTLEAFDFEAQPSIDPAQIRQLATCRWVANGDTLLLLRPPGVGTTHLAVALGREAVRLGHSVQYVGAMEPISALAKAQVIKNAAPPSGAAALIAARGPVTVTPECMDYSSPQHIRDRKKDLTSHSSRSIDAGRAAPLPPE